MWLYKNKRYLREKLLRGFLMHGIALERLVIGVISKLYMIPSCWASPLAFVGPGIDYE